MGISALVYLSIGSFVVVLLVLILVPHSLAAMTRSLREVVDVSRTDVSREEFMVSDVVLASSNSRGDAVRNLLMVPSGALGEVSRRQIQGRRVQ